MRINMDKNITKSNSEESTDPIFDYMFKKFLQQVKKDKIIEQVRVRRYYSKPSEIKRLAQKARNRNAR